MSVHNGFRTRGQHASLPPFALAGLVAILAVSGCAADKASSAGVGASSAPTPASASASPTAASPTGSTVAVQGFVGFDDFPMQFEGPAGLEDASEGVGTRTVVISGAHPTAFLLGSVASTPAADLPADLAGFIGKARPNALVSEVRSRDVGGLPAQSFTLTQSPGTNPSDLWCAEAGYCFKLLTNKPMDMTAVRTPKGLVLFSIEYFPEERSQSRKVMEQVLTTVRWE